MVVATFAVAACSGGDEPAASETTTTAGESSATTSTRPPTFTGDPQSAFCRLLRDVDPSTVLAGDPGDPAAIEIAFRRLVGLLRDARALAPPEIEADLALVSEGFEALDATLAQVGYDFDVLAASGESATVTDAVNDPAFTAAGDRLGAYRTRVCQL